jgi:iron complex transport system ATP-binding protein
VHAERRTTVLLVTHELAAASELSTRVLLLKDGRAIAEGPTAEVLTPPALQRAFGVAFATSPQLAAVGTPLSEPPVSR